MMLMPLTDAFAFFRLRLCTLFSHYAMICYAITLIIGDYDIDDILLLHLLILRLLMLYAFLRYVRLLRLFFRWPDMLFASSRRHTL